MTHHHIANFALSGCSFFSKIADKFPIWHGFFGKRFASTSINGGLILGVANKQMREAAQRNGQLAFSRFRTIKAVNQVHSSKVVVVSEIRQRTDIINPIDLRCWLC